MSQGCHNHRDPAIFTQRLADWRNCQRVYQVFVDRFAAGGDPQARAAHYAHPQRLVPWSEKPRRGRYLPEAGACTHELAFWGGDLSGVRQKLDYIRDLGCNVLYLNPIFRAYTNHKYDTIDYFEIDPHFGTDRDFSELCDSAHERGMRVVLDGVFNHVGRRSAMVGNRDWLTGSCWRDVGNLPELRLEHAAVRAALFDGPDSVVRHYLRRSDGWRLDVACDLGPHILAELTASAHAERPDGLVVGEFFNYPAEWFRAIDGAVNIFLGAILLDLVKGASSAGKTARILEELVADCGIEPLLRSWTVVSNHDKPRLRTELPELRDRTFLWALMVALPGAPLVYYGEEIGLEGGADPTQRGPMDWDLAHAGSAAEQQTLRKLLALRRQHPALQVGDYVPVAADRLLAFARRTATVRETVIALANPSHETITEPVCPRESWLLDSTPLRELVAGGHATMRSGRLEASVPPRTVQLWVAADDIPGRYSFLKRVP